MIEDCLLSYEKCQDLWARKLKSKNYKKLKQRVVLLKEGDEFALYWTHYRRTEPQGPAWARIGKDNVVTSTNKVKLARTKFDLGFKKWKEKLYEEAGAYKWVDVPLDKAA